MYTCYGSVTLTPEVGTTLSVSGMHGGVVALVGIVPVKIQRIGVTCEGLL